MIPTITPFIHIFSSLLSAPHKLILFSSFTDRLFRREKWDLPFLKQIYIYMQVAKWHNWAYSLTFADMLLPAGDRKQTLFHILYKKNILKKDFFSKSHLITHTATFLMPITHRVIFFNISLTVAWCSNVTQSSNAGGVRVLTLPGRWAYLETETQKEIHIIGAYLMHCPKLYIWCSPSISQWQNILYFMKTISTFSSWKMLVYQPWSWNGWTWRCTRDWTQLAQLSESQNTLLKKKKRDCFGFGCLGWLSGRALQRR